MWFISWKSVHNQALMWEKITNTIQGKIKTKSQEFFDILKVISCCYKAGLFSLTKRHFYSTNLNESSIYCVHCRAWCNIDKILNARKKSSWLLVIQNLECRIFISFSSEILISTYFKQLLPIREISHLERSCAQF